MGSSTVLTTTQTLPIITNLTTASTPTAKSTKYLTTEIPAISTVKEEELASTTQKIKIPQPKSKATLATEAATEYSTTETEKLTTPFGGKMTIISEATATPPSTKKSISTEYPTVRYPTTPQQYLTTEGGETVAGVVELTTRPFKEQVSTEKAEIPTTIQTSQTTGDLFTTEISKELHVTSGVIKNQTTAELESTTEKATVIKGVTQPITTYTPKKPSTSKVVELPVAKTESTTSSETEENYTVPMTVRPLQPQATTEKLLKETALETEKGVTQPNTVPTTVHYTYTGEKTSVTSTLITTETSIVGESKIPVTESQPTVSTTTSSEAKENYTIPMTVRPLHPETTTEKELKETTLATKTSLAGKSELPTVGTKPTILITTPSEIEENYTIPMTVRSLHPETTTEKVLKETTPTTEKGVTQPVTIPTIRYTYTPEKTPVTSILTTTETTVVDKSKVSTSESQSTVAATTPSGAEKNYSIPLTVRPETTTAKILKETTLVTETGVTQPITTPSAYSPEKTTVAPTLTITETSTAGKSKIPTAEPKPPIFAATPSEMEENYTVSITVRPLHPETATEKVVKETMLPVTVESYPSTSKKPEETESTTKVLISQTRESRITSAPETSSVLTTVKYETPTETIKAITYKSAETTKFITEKPTSQKLEETSGSTVPFATTESISFETVKGEVIRTEITGEPTIMSTIKPLETETPSVLTGHTVSKPYKESTSSREVITTPLILGTTFSSETTGTEKHISNVTEVSIVLSTYNEQVETKASTKIEPTEQTTAREAGLRTTILSEKTETSPSAKSVPLETTVQTGYTAEVSSTTEKYKSPHTISFETSTSSRKTPQFGSTLESTVNVTGTPYQLTTVASTETSATSNPVFEATFTTEKHLKEVTVKAPSLVTEETKPNVTQVTQKTTVPISTIIPSREITTETMLTAKTFPQATSPKTVSQELSTSSSKEAKIPFTEITTMYPLTSKESIQTEKSTHRITTLEKEHTKITTLKPSTEKEITEAPLATEVPSVVSHSVTTEIPLPQNATLQPSKAETSSTVVVSTEPGKTTESAVSIISTLPTSSKTEKPVSVTTESLTSESTTIFEFRTTETVPTETTITAEIITVENLTELTLNRSKEFCKTNNDCSVREICWKDQCISPCQIGGTCAVTAKCSVYNHTVECVCPLGYLGDPKEECILKGITQTYRL